MIRILIETFDLTPSIVRTDDESASSVKWSYNDENNDDTDTAYHLRGTKIEIDRRDRDRQTDEIEIATQAVAVFGGVQLGHGLGPRAIYNFKGPRTLDQKT